MKVLVAVLFVLCTTALCSPEPSDQDNVHTLPTCCFSYVSRQIPRKIVNTYFNTSSLCPSPGIVFLTKKSRQICANPSNAWVQEYITDLDKNV